MLDLEEIRRALQDRVITAVASHTGLSRATVAAIKSGDAKTVSRKTQMALSAYLAPRYDGKS